MENNQDGPKTPTAFLVDLVSNRKIPVATPRCRVGRDDLNDIVISGDQSISRFHFIISLDNDEFTVQDAKSRHGTFLNGNALTSPEPIKDGDVLKVGVSLFWFVVESQSEKGEDSSPKPSAIEGQEEAKAVELKTPKEGDKPTPGAREHTQEMAKPDANLMDKLEQAANSIQIEEKAAPKASLASLLQPLQEDSGKDNGEDDVKAKLAARDKELMAEIEAASESDDEANATAGSAKEGADKFPQRILNKPSDTVTIEAMPSPTQPEESLQQTAKEETAEVEEAEKPKEKVIEPPKIALGNLLAASDNDSAEKSGLGGLADMLKEENTNGKTTASIEAAPVVEAEPVPQESAKSEAEEAEKSEPEKEPENSAHGNSDTEKSDEEKSDQEKSEKDAIKEQSQTGEISVGNSIEEAKDLASAKADEVQATQSPERMGEETSVASQPAKAEEPVEAVTRGIELDSAILTNATAGAIEVPDWCKKYFSDEIGKLNKELDELNDQVKLAQQKIRDVETRVALTRGIRNTLLTTTGDELVEASGKVLGLLGWKVTISAEDKHELRLEFDDKQVCIARVIWTTTQAERSHLGQLSISQTRYWCEKGVEPKGILIVSKIGDGPPQAGGTSAEDVELADYANKKNVCLMTTLQLLALYKEVALGDAKPEVLRSAVAHSNGWLDGYDLEPGASDSVEKDDAPTNKLSSLLSA